MVERVSEHFCVHAVVVVVGFAGLLPPQVQEQVFAVGHFLPVLARRHHPSDQGRVVSLADIESEFRVGEGHRFCNCGASAFVVSLVFR